MRRALAAVTGALVLAGAGYVTADVLDVAPGVLTWDDGTWHASADRASAKPSAGQVVLPRLPASGAPLEPPGADDPVPGKVALRKRLDALVADPWLEPSVGVVVRDGLTGTTLYTHEASRPRLAASTQKLLAAAAIVTDLDVHGTLDTRVVRGTKGDQVVIVAGGDTVLGRGSGDPSRVGGRAGLADLAGQVATSLIAAGSTRATVSVDLSYARGPAHPSTWEMADVAAGATQGVHMIGFDDQRPRIGHASPADPPLEVARAFVTQLDALGIQATLAPRAGWAAVEAGPTQLGVVHSAPIGDVLSLALDESDNAMTEGLCRIGAVESGVRSDFRSTATHVVARLKQLEVDTSGVYPPRLLGPVPRSADAGDRDLLGPRARDDGAECSAPGPRRQAPRRGAHRDARRPLHRREGEVGRRRPAGQDRDADGDERRRRDHGGRRRPAPVLRRHRRPGAGQRGNARGPGRVGPLRRRTDQVRLSMTREGCPP